MARAQNEPLRRSDVVPLDLATALATAGGFTAGGDPQILVGAIPEFILPRFHIPSGSRVLGSAFLGSTVVGVISVPTWSDTLVKDIERGFQRLGWKKLPSSGASGGFRPTPVATSMNAPVPVPQTFSLCVDNQTLTVRTFRQAASTNVVMRVSGATSGFNPCVPRVFPGQADRPPVPTLYDPAGATNRNSMDCVENMESSGGLAMVNGSGTRLRTSMTPDAVVDHYGRQLADSGWKIKPDARISIVRTWVRADSTGRNVEATLTVQTLGKDSSCKDVNLMMSVQRDR
jgi:hypothetical protein